MTYPKPAFKYLIVALLTVFNLSNSSAQTVQKLDSLFGTLAKQGYLNGCVLIAKDGKPIYEKPFGYANFDTKQPLTNQTMFELASVSKQFTSMAIMQLHQQGKLGYDDSLNKYFPNIPYHGITINHLLHHTSGLPEFIGWDDKLIDVNRYNYNKDILAAMIKNAPAKYFDAGNSFTYSNTNYVLLALIVEKVSGLSFSDYLNKNIFKPLGMSHTKVYPQRLAKEKIKDYAYGYLYDPLKAKFVINDDIKANRFEYYFDGVSGPYGISSNTGDMLKWDQALYTEKLVSHKEQEAAYVPYKLKDGKDASLAGMLYGFGWLILPPKPGEGKNYLHSGGYPGYMTMISRFPDQHTTIIILTNIYNVINLYQLTFAAENILFNKPFTMPVALPFQKSMTLNPAQIKAVEGTYSLKEDARFKIIITSESGQVYAQLTNQPKVEVYPEDELTFFYTVVAAKLRFKKDEQGAITKVTLQQGGKEFEATREEVKK